MTISKPCACGTSPCGLCLLIPRDQFFIPLNYYPPGDVGADRIVNAVAALELYGSPAIVVDFGTATTFDVVSAKGEYEGGLIFPGIGISSEALFSRTAKLPRVEFRKPGKIVGQSTEESIQSGLYYGYVNLIGGILGQLKAEVPGGRDHFHRGFAGMIGSGIIPAYLIIIEEDLTVKGPEDLLRPVLSRMSWGGNAGKLFQLFFGRRGVLRTKKGERTCWSPPWTGP